MKLYLQDKGTARRIRGAAIGALTLGCSCLAAGDGAFGAEPRMAVGLAAVPSEAAPPAVPDGRAEFEAWLPRALAGDPAAAFRLGRAFAHGAAHWEDFAEAAHWFRKAARAGYRPAQLDLAMLYGKGLGVPRDYVKSYAWFAVAAESPDSGLARDQALELRDMMAAFLSPEQRAEAERLAQDLRRARTGGP